jgi:hypothetical protein
MLKKSNSIMRSRLLLAALCGAAIAGSMFAPPAQADEWDKKTILTVDQPIQVTKTVLPPGQYVFKLLSSQSDRHIVQIFNTRENHLYATVLAIPNYRLEPEGHSRFRFWETPAGRVKALRAWFYPGDNFGQEFAYPKHLAMAETTTASTSNTITQSSTADRSMEETTTEPQPQTQAVTEPQMTEPQTNTQQQEQQPVETAENTPPPVMAEPEQPAPQPAAAPAPALPKTASPYPLIGLSGLLLLGICGFLRRQHT